jgi:MFS family permease
MVYLRLLRVERIGPLMAAMMVGRVSISINALAIVLFLRDARGSFAVAGAVAGALALGTGLGAPLLGRVVDRLGRGMLAPIAVAHAAGLVGLALLGESAAPLGVLLALAVVTGVAAPPISSVLRALYPHLVRGRPELLPVAYALDSILTELLFVLGPLIVSALVLLGDARGALFVAAGTVLAGTAWFLALLPASERRRIPRHQRGPRPGAMGALASPALQVLTATMLPVGICFGMLEVVVPAFARVHGQPEATGVLLAIWSVASAAGGFAYTRLRASGELPRVHAALAVAVPLCTVPMLLATSVPAMALLLVLTGLPVGPLVAMRNELAGATALPGTQTEAYTWVLTAMVGGIAIGAALGGVLVDAPGWRTATVVAVALAAAGAAMAVAGQQRIARALDGRA